MPEPLRKIPYTEPSDTLFSIPNKDNYEIDEAEWLSIHDRFDRKHIHCTTESPRTIMEEVWFTNTEMTECYGSIWYGGASAPPRLPKRYYLYKIPPQEYLLPPMPSATLEVDLDTFIKIAEKASGGAIRRGNAFPDSGSEAQTDN